MILKVRYSLYAIVWTLVWLFVGIGHVWAQSSPNSASAIRQTEQENKIKILGSLCTPTASAPASGTAPASANANCDSDPVSFYDVDPLADKSKTSWVIDGGAPQVGMMVSTSFTTPGVKSVTITRTISTTAQSTSVVSSTALPPTTFTVSVGTRPQPFQQWRSDTTICKGTELKIDPYPQGAPTGVTYLWFPKGETTQAISTTASGCYSVEVTNEAGCSTQDRIKVSLCPEQNASPGSKWYFGNNAGLDFQGNSPKPLTDGKLSTIEGSASITDNKGNILFYSDGITVYDKDGKPMQLYDPISGSLTSSSAVLGGNQRSTQSAIIVPKPVCRGCDYLYYVYTTAEINGTRQITYSVVDMRRNNGSGAVVQQNLPVVTSSTSASSTERSASVRRDRDTTYWVMTHDYGSNCFRVDHLTASTRVEQKQFCLGTSHDSPARGEGQIKIGPAPPAPTSTTGASGSVGSGTATQGNSNTAVRPVAVIIPGDSTSSDPERRKSYVEIFSFDVEKGELKGPDKRIDLGPAPPTAYGVEFSPDGKQVYVSLLGGVTSVSGVQTQTGASRIIQYDITASDPASTSALIEESTTRQYGSLQIGPDGRIYVAVQGKTSLAVIDNPNGTTAVSTNPFAKPPVFILEGQDLGGKLSQLGLPNQVANFNEPTSSAGVSASNVCEGEPVEFQITPFCPKLKENYNLTILNSSGAVVTKLASFTQTSQTVQVSQPGTYSAILDVQVITSTGATCTTATAETSFTVIQQPPKFNLPDVNVCTDKPVSVTNTAVAEQYAWVLGRQIVSRSRVLVTTRPGTYTAFIANGGQCFESDVVVIKIRIPPRLNLGPDVPLCENTTRTVAVPAAQGYEQFRWSNGATTREIVITQPGTYSVTGTINYPDVVCEASDEINVIQAKKPTLTAALTNPAGCTTLDGAIVITPAPTTVVSGTATPTNSFTYAWAGGTGTPISTTGNSVSTLSEGRYQVRVTDENTCFTDASYQLTSRSPALRLTAQPGTQRCDVPGSGSATLGVSGGTPTQYEWRNSSGIVVSTSPSLTGVAAGVYSVSVADNLGCVASLTNVTIGIDSKATLSLAPNRSKCVNDTVVLIPSRLGDATSGVSYRWSTGSTNGSISVNTSGTYSLTAINNINGCVGNASVDVQFVTKPNVSAGSNLSLCLGAPNSLTSLQLTGNSPGGGVWGGPNVSPAGQFSATAGLIGQVVTVTYSATVNGCANSASRQVALKQTPQVNAGPDAEFCEGVGQTLQATGSPGATFRWNDGTQGSQLRPQQTGRYVVTANLDGCEQTDDAQVNVKPAPRFALTREAAICVGDNGQTQLRVVPQGTGQNVVWITTNTTSTTLLVSRVGTYSVVVTGSNGCVASDAARVIDLCEPRLFSSNAFSPNGDGLNDKFGTLNAYTTDLELRVYNRWGEVIFASTPETPEWDGTYRGEPAQTMVYPYVISYRSQYFPERPAVVKRGSVLLLR